MRPRDVRDVIGIIRLVFLHVATPEASVVRYNVLAREDSRQQRSTEALNTFVLKGGTTTERG